MRTDCSSIVFTASSDHIFMAFRFTKKKHETAVATNTHPVPGYPRNAENVSPNDNWQSFGLKPSPKFGNTAQRWRRKKTDGAGGSGNATELRRTLQLMVYEDTVEMSLVHSVVILYILVYCLKTYSQTMRQMIEKVQGVVLISWEPQLSGWSRKSAIRDVTKLPRRRCRRLQRKKKKHALGFCGFFFLGGEGQVFVMNFVWAMHVMKGADDGFYGCFWAVFFWRCNESDYDGSRESPT